MTAEKKNRYGLMRSFAVLCVIMGTYFSFATAVSAFVLIDVFTLAGVLLVIWGASAAFEILVPSMPAKTRRYVTYGVSILLCIMIGYCGIDVIQGTGGFVQMFKDHVSDRQVMMPSHDPSATFIGFAAISSAAVALLGTRRNTLPLVVLITFPVVEVCLYFALVPLHSAFAALMIGYAALGAMDLIPGEDRGRTSDARSQSAFAASVLMCAAIVAGSLYTAIVGRSKAADQFRESFLNYVADFSVQKFTEDVKQALLPSRDHSLTHDGQLGTVDKVEFKGTSMLEVTVPSDIDGLYLKGFTGERYTGTRWSEAEPPPELATDITSAEFFPGRMLKYVPGYTELPAEYIVVRNTDAAPNDRYFPQNAAGLIETDGTRRKYWAYLPRDKGWSMDLIADAPLDLAGLPPEMYADEQMLRTGAYDNYLTIPASFTAHRDFFDGTEGDTTAQILKYIHDKLSRDCEYDLEAGRLPFGRDLAQWFLT
ncbi:MAG: hypothetical protein IKR73_04365, partial [Oscillospiraceae bacterium]|nr:hypothetical protein [Oscillospiraceae bacterium]